MKAGVLSGVGQDIEIVDVDLQDPKAGEVRVRMAASGVCHSDLSVQNGTLPLPTPIVLGHEGAGVVEAVGDGVTNVAPGDHVVLSWVPECGHCYTCLHDQPQLCENSLPTQMGALLDGTTRFSRDASPVFQMAGTGTFAESTIVPAISAVKIPQDMPLDKAALIGCGVLTGFGAAVNTAKIRPGDTVAVVGCGGVGLNAIQGAKIAGAGQIIAVDMLDQKLELAKQFGATDTVNASEGDPVVAVQGLAPKGPMGMGRGVDVAIEVVGMSATFNQALAMTRRGGMTVFVGAPRMDDMTQLNLFMDLFASQKTITGSFYGGANVHRDIPMLVDLYQRGILKLDELVSKTISLAEVNTAFEDMKGGTVARSVIVYD